MAEFINELSSQENGDVVRTFPTVVFFSVKVSLISFNFWLSLSSSLNNGPLPQMVDQDSDKENTVREVFFSTDVLMFWLLTD